MLGFFAKLYPKVLGLVATLDPKSNIYNINNKIKLRLTLSIKVSGMQYQTQ